MTVLPRGFGAVTSTRIEPPDSLDDFPTPPWGTRALYRYVLPHVFPDTPLRPLTVWEPTANRGLMVEVLRDLHETVFASDVFDYGRGYAVGSFIGEGQDVARCSFDPDLIIFNGPFRLNVEFAYRALELARIGVLMLARTAWFDTKERDELFDRHPLAAFSPYMGRLPMHRARWDPDGSTTTAYSWFIWRKDVPAPRFPPVIRIPYCAEAVCTLPDDRRRFAHAILPADLPSEAEASNNQHQGSLL